MRSEVVRLFPDSLHSYGGSLSFGRSWMQAIITLFLLPILAAPNVWGMTLGEIRFVSASKLGLYTFCIYFIFARNEKNIEILYNFKPG